MEAVILAAGQGSRLGPLTDSSPKCLLQVGDRGIIDHQLRVLETFGIRRVHVVTGYMSEVLEQHLQTHYQHFDLNVIFNPYYDLTNVIGSFWLASREIRDEFIYMHADTIFDRSILGRLLGSDGNIALAVDRKPCGDEEMKVYLEDERLRYITKQRNPEQAYGEFIGVARISRAAASYLRDDATTLMRQRRFDQFFEAIIQRILDENALDVSMVDITGSYWQEIDFLEDLEMARGRFGESDLK